MSPLFITLQYRTFVLRIGAALIEIIFTIKAVRFCNKCHNKHYYIYMTFYPMQYYSVGVY